MNPIKGAGGTIRGYIKETSTGQTLFAPGGKVLGYYNESMDITTTAGGRFIGYGNQLMTLIED